MLYELINPSDPITFYADTLAAATGAVVLIGRGWYGAEPEDEGYTTVPLMSFMGAEAFQQWFQERFDAPVDDLSGFLSYYRKDIIQALRTFATASFAERQLYDVALAAITDSDKRAEFLAQWDDIKRSSLNDIVNKAHKIADELAAVDGDLRSVSFSSAEPLILGI